MVTKPLGHTETFVQEMEGQQFLVHCTKDSDYVTKIMSPHGVLDEIQDNATWRLMDGVWRTFKYAEPFSRHNCAKHWVDDVNNHCHDPSLEDVWATKWWPNRQFTFLLSVTEVNAVQTRARAKKGMAMPTLEFCKKLAMRMMTNKLNDNGVAAASPVRTRARTLSKHVIVKQQKGEGSWNVYTLNKRDTLYIPHPCSECRAKTRSYCKCDPRHPLCMDCLESMPTSMAVEMT